MKNQFINWKINLSTEKFIFNWKLIGSLLIGNLIRRSDNQFINLTINKLIRQSIQQLDDQYISISQSIGQLVN